MAENTRHTSIEAPLVRPDLTYTLHVPSTGEIQECDDIAPLLRNAARLLAGERWGALEVRLRAMTK